MASMPAPCPSLFSRIHGLSHPYSSHQTKKRPSRLSIRHHPVPPFRAPSQRGRRRSWVGINTGYVHHPLLGPRPSRPRQHLSHHQIRTRTTVSPPSPPLFIPMLMPQPPPTTPLTCVFRHARPRPYPLSPFQSNSNTSHPWLTVSASHA